MIIYIINGFDTYEHRVDFLYKILTDYGHKVRVLSSDYKHIDKQKRTERKEGFKFFNTEPYHKNLSLQRMRSHVHLSKAIFTYVERKIESIDLLWVLAPPNSFVKDAARLKRKYSKLKLVFDIIDMWPETMPIGRIKNFYPIKIWGDIRDKNINIADFVVTECDLYQMKLKKYVSAKKMKTIYLARESETYHFKPNLPKDKIALCYLGSINHIIDIPEIGRVIQGFQKYQDVELHIIGGGEKKKELLTVAQSMGVDVIDYGMIYDKTKKQEIFDCCHYGINIYKKNVFIGLTMKCIDYFEGGLPIINNIKGDTWKFVEQYQCGINVPHQYYYDDEFRKNAREVFERNFSVRNFEKAIASLESVNLNEKI